MAQRTISAAGGNFNATASWVEGVVPTSSDFVVGNAASGNLTITSLQLIQYMDLSAYRGILGFSASTFETAYLGINLNGGTTTFGASMSFTFSGGPSAFFPLEFLPSSSHTIIQNTTSRIPCLSFGGSTNTITLSTNLYVNTIRKSASSTGRTTLNGNRIFVNQYCLNPQASGFGTYGGTTTFTFDGPVSFNRNPSFSLTNLTINTNSILYLQPLLQNNLTLATTPNAQSDRGLEVGDFYIQQGTISMTGSMFPFINLPQTINGNIRIDEPTIYNFYYFSSTGTTTGPTFNLNLNNMGDFIVWSTYPMTSGATSSHQFTINAQKDLTIQRFRYFGSSGVPGFSSNGTNALHGSFELILAGTYSVSIRDIVSLGSGDYILPQTGGYNTTGAGLPNNTWLGYNMIRSSVAGTRRKLNLTGGTNSVFMNTNFRDIDASGGNPIKVFNPIGRGSQIDNSINIRTITGMNFAETSSTFLY